MVELAVLIVATCCIAVTATVIIHQRRQDVLYGPYIEQMPRIRNVRMTTSSPAVPDGAIGRSQSRAGLRARGTSRASTSSDPARIPCQPVIDQRVQPVRAHALATGHLDADERGAEAQIGIGGEQSVL